MAARVFDTPTPPSQSYSALQTSLRPANQQNNPITSTVLPKSRLNQQIHTSALDGMSESSFTSTDFGRPEEAQQQQQQRTHQATTYNKSVGFGDAGVGLGMDDRERFADLYKINNNNKAARDTAHAGTGRTKRTRVDEYSDVSPDGTSDAEDQSNTTASEDDEFSARLAGRNNHHQTRNTSTPFPNHYHNNQSKSAFDGMARELRKEFERIMDSGKAARTHRTQSDNENIPPPPPSSSAISPSAAQRRYSLQQPPLNVAPAAVPPLPATRQPMPRGVAPRRSPVKASERPGYERKDSTPTAIRTFGQELPIYRQASQQQQQPSRASFAGADPSPKQQQYKNALSPFQVSSSQGIQPPNNTRATSHQSIFSQAAPPHQLSAALASPDRQSIPSSYSPLRVPDITGLTDGLSSPSRATSNPSSHRVLANTLGGSPKLHGKSANRSVEDPVLSSALVSLRKRLDALEQENARSEAKVAELEDKLAAAATTQQIPASSHQEDLVATLRGEIDRLQSSIQQQALALAALQSEKRVEEEFRDPRHPLSQQRASSQARQGDQAWMQEFVMLRDTLGSLADQVAEVRRVLEDVLDSLRKIPTAPRYHPRDQELLREQPSTPTRRSSRQRREELLASPPQNISRQHSAPEYYYAPTYKGPLLDRQRQQSKQQHQQQRATSAPLPENIAHRVTRNFSAPPNYSEPLLDRAERILSNLPPSIHNHAQSSCEVCRSREQADQHHHRQHAEMDQREHTDAILRAQYDENSSHRYASRANAKRASEDEQLPMQTVISRALRDLEDDFSTHKRIYIELSDEYKRMDPATPDVGKRKILALHLKESIDVLELKADEIKRLYDLLHYRSELQQTQDAARLRNLGLGRHI